MNITFRHLNDETPSLFPSNYGKTNELDYGVYQHPTPSPDVLTNDVIAPLDGPTTSMNHIYANWTTPAYDSIYDIAFIQTIDLFVLLNLDPIRSPEIDRIPPWSFHDATVQITFHDAPVLTKTTMTYTIDDDPATGDPNYRTSYACGSGKYQNIFEVVVPQPAPQLSAFLFGVSRPDADFKSDLTALAKADLYSETAFATKIMDAANIFNQMRMSGEIYPAFHIGLVPGLISPGDVDDPSKVLQMLRDTFFQFNLELDHLVADPNPIHDPSFRYPIWTGTLEFLDLKYTAPALVAGKGHLGDFGFDRTAQYTFPTNAPPVDV